MTNVLAADIGGTNLRIAIIDDNYSVHEAYSLDVSHLTHLERYEYLEKCIEEILPKIKDYECSSVGLSLSGHVDRTNGTIYIADDEDRFVAYPISEKISKATGGMACTVVNDGTAIALAEWKSGAAIGSDNVVSVHFGTYTASGVICLGEPVEKRTGSPLLGAILVEKLDGVIQETNLDFSGAGLALTLQQHIKSHPESELANSYSPDQKAGEYIFKMAQQGNKDAQGIYREAGKKLGVHLASIMNVFDPQVVTLGGRMMEAKDYFLPETISIVDEYARHSVDTDKGHPGQKIVPARYSADGGLIGAAVAARWHQVESQS